MQALLVVVVVLNSLILLGVIIGLIVVIRKVGKTIDATESAMEQVSREIGPTMRSLQATLDNVGSLAAKAEQELSRVDGVLARADKLASGVAVAGAAFRAVKGGGLSVAGVLTGVKEGLRLIKSRRADSKKEES